MSTLQADRVPLPTSDDERSLVEQHDDPQHSNHEYQEEELRPHSPSRVPLPQSTHTSPKRERQTTQIAHSPVEYHGPPTSSSEPHMVDQSSDLDLGIDRHADAGESSMLLDKEMTRKLLEMESSFMPDEANTSVRAGEALFRGADDTFLFGGANAHTVEQADHEELGDLTQSPLPTPASAYKTPFPGVGGDSSRPSSRDQSSTLTNSPAAAAASRAQKRMSNPQAPAEDLAQPEGVALFKKPEVLKEKYGIYTLTADDDVPQPQAQQTPVTDGLGASTTQQAMLPNSTGSSTSSRLLKRPSFHARQTSMRSTISSLSAISLSEEGGDAGLGADYAIQSGGAAPTGGSIRREVSFSRLPSIGSMAGSLISSRAGSFREWGRSRSSTSISTAQGEGALENLNNLQAQAREASPPLTPRPFDYAQAAPTDTVIAQHVQNIKVPETVAREYREMHNTSPRRRQTNSLSFGRRNNLTLKEQNSKIDKLSKENFDLKLKIHFLDQALQNRSEEGVKDMINKNVQLQTDLATEKKENLNLKRKIRELERKIQQHDDALHGDRSDAPRAGDSQSERSEMMEEMEEEIVTLRELISQCEIEIEHLRTENINKEADKRRLAEHIKFMSESRSTDSKAFDEESADMWKDLLEAETARREQADIDAATLREEIFKLKGELAASRANQHSLNSNRRGATGHSSRPSTAFSGNSIGQDRVVDSRGSTLVETLQHENAELRRDLSAQTQMLTSRNRERERLQQEIEELKLHHRQGGGRSVAGDSIFERSVSRAHQRSDSRASRMTKNTQLSEQEKDEYERKTAGLHDELAQIRMVNQDLERELNAHLDLLQTAEAQNEALKQDRRLATEDLQLLQAERDELLQAVEEREEQFEQLREEALASIEELETEVEQKERDFLALQTELSSVSESIIRLEDELQASRRKEASLDQQIEDNEREIAALEKKMRETLSKNERLDVQLESSQGEIAFLREEQDADKLRIGELEAALSSTQAAAQEHRERSRDLQTQLSDEKKQRERLDSQEKQAVQQMLDELNRENTKSKDEIRKLRRSLQTKESEALTWKERLETLEGSLREALGDLDGTRSSLLKDVARLQHDLEKTISNYENAKADLAEREALLRSRDTLLENTAIETRKLSDLLDKERAARQKDRTQFDQMQRSQQSLTRTIQQTDNRTVEAETRLASERKRWSSAEHTYLQQLHDRNGLLFALWTKLAAIASPGNEEGEPISTALPYNFGLIDGVEPSTEVVARNLPGFARNINIAARTIEVFVQGFRARVREMDRTLWRDVQKLEHGLEVRTKRLEHLERLFASSDPAKTANRTGITSMSMGHPAAPGSATELAKLKNENKMLKSDLKQARRDTQASPTRSISISSVMSGEPPMSPTRHDSTTLRRATRGPHNQGGHAHKNSVESAVAAMPLPMNDMAGLSDRPHTSITSGPAGHISASPVPNVPLGPAGKSLVRHNSSHSTSTSTHDQRGREVSLQAHHNSHPDHQSSAPLEPTTQSALNQQSSSGSGSGEQKWIYRLKELERRLKAERELRLLDRSGARKRIEEERGEKEELKRMLEKERNLRDAVLEIEGQHPKQD